MTTPDIAEARTQFDYLLNAYTAAAQADKPAEHDYKVKREALFAYVRETERAARNQAAEVERLRSAVHSCGPTCDKAGCVNARLTQELERLRAQVATVDGHRHIYNGACPDEGNWGSRDPECPACRALGAAPAKQADPARELLLQRIVDGAKPGEGALTASLRAVARDALVQQAPPLTVGDEPVAPAALQRWEAYQQTRPYDLYASGLISREKYVALAAEAEPVALTEKQRLYFGQAHEMLDEYADELDRRGNNSTAAGARASAHQLRAVLAASHQPGPVVKPCLFGGDCKHGGWCSDVYCQERCQFKKAGSLRAIADLMQQADGGWNLPASATKRIAELLDDMLSASPAHPAAQGVGTDEKLAASIAGMVIEWVDGGISMGTDWRSGLADIIARRIARAAPAPRDDEELGEVIDWANKLGAIGHPDRAAAAIRTLAQAPAAEPQWQPIADAPDDALCVVGWRDAEAGEEHHDLDWREDGCWSRHHDHAEHVEVIGGHGVSYTAPYTHFVRLAPLPAA